MNISTAYKTIMAVATLLLLLAQGCGTSHQTSAHKPERSDATTGVPGAALENHQRELLQLGFDAASEIPIKPHLKSRSLYQRKVVSACLELAQPELAERYAAKIGNWHRGAAHADIGLFYAQHDNPEIARQQLGVAEDIAEAIKDWHAKQIRARIARAYAVLGDNKKAAELTGQLEELEAAKVKRSELAASTADDFEEQMDGIKKLFDSKRFDVQLQALFACTKLFDRFYDDAERREAAVSFITGSWAEIAPIFRIELLFALTERALSHADMKTASNLLLEATSQYEQAEWRPEDGVPLQAKLAGFLYRADNGRAARQLIAGALKDYQKGKEEVPPVFRVRSILPVAENYRVMGESKQAIAVYRAALEEGASNVNGRPRAEDLTRICSSMAQSNVEPTPELWSRLREVRNHLGAPW